MALINVPDIQNLDAATPESINSRLGTIANEINGNLNAANLLDGAVTAPKLATDAVTTGKITDANVTPVKWTNPYKFSAYRNAAYTGAASATIITFDTELFDTNNNFSTSTGLYTAPVTGYYWFNTNINFASSNGVNNVGASYLYKNGASNRTLAQWTVGAINGGAGGSGGAFIQLIAGDTVGVYAYISSTTGLQYAFFEGHLVTIT